jgi:hypothetical protein
VDNFPRMLVAEDTRSVLEGWMNPFTFDSVDGLASEIDEEETKAWIGPWIDDWERLCGPKDEGTNLGERLKDDGGTSFSTVIACTCGGGELEEKVGIKLRDIDLRFPASTPPLDGRACGAASLPRLPPLTGEGGDNNCSWAGLGFGEEAGVLLLFRGDSSIYSMAAEISGPATSWLVRWIDLRPVGAAEETATGIGLGCFTLCSSIAFCTFATTKSGGGPICEETLGTGCLFKRPNAWKVLVANCKAGFGSFFTIKDDIPPLGTSRLDDGASDWVPSSGSLARPVRLRPKARLNLLVADSEVP